MAERCEVIPGDNREGSKKLHDIADRVLLGLLPSSEAAWPLAVACLKQKGGWLHVHENVAEAEIVAWSSKVEADIKALALAIDKSWEVSVRHIEKVKTYAPRVWHVVADIECRDVAALA